MREHRLRTWPSYFDAVKGKEKTFEVRLNDRDFAMGDILVLEEYDPAPGVRGGVSLGHTGRKLRCLVTYVMHGGRFGIGEHVVVMAIQVVDSDKAKSE